MCNVYVFYVDTVDTILYGIYALNGTNVDTVDTTTCIYLLSRLVKEITYREFRRLQSKSVTPPVSQHQGSYEGKVCGVSFEVAEISFGMSP